MACRRSIALLRILLLSAGVSLFGLCAAIPAARANDRFTLDTHAESPGKVVEDAAGNAYIGWIHEPEGSAVNVPMFCKVAPGGTCTDPITLPIPAATDDVDDVSGIFTVLGPGSTVYVVGPRYVQDDVVIWTSTDGGESFGPGTVNEGGYSDKSDPTDVLLRGTELLIGAHNPGLAFSATPAAGGPGTHFEFKSPGTGGVAGSTMGLDPSGNPVEAYWNLLSPYQVLFYRYKGSGPLTNETDWVGPTAAAAGYEPRLAGGGAGLFLASQDYAPGATEPYVLEVRKYEGTSFGAPIALENDPSINLFDGGAIAESPGGRLAVAWPNSQGDVMRLFTSTDGGASFTQSEIAHLGSGYGDFENAEMSIDDSGAGWLTYLNSSGLQVADLAPLPVPSPPAPSSPTSSPPPVKKAQPKVFTGATQTTTAAVGGNLLTLTVPKVCLAPDQPFYIGVGKKARHKVARSLRSSLKVAKVTFFFDGRKLKTLKKKPFRYLVQPGALSGGGKHTVSARVTAIVIKHGHKKTVVRVLKGQISIC